MKYFSVHRHDSVLHLVFEDATSRNSFSVAAARELREILKPIVNSSDRAVSALALSARGRVFCSGGNLSDYASMSSASEGTAVNTEIRLALSELASLPIPTVCIVEGDCFGGGVELVSCFDHVIAASHVMFGLWQRKISLTYGWGGGSRLARRLGSGTLRNLSLTTRSVGTREALSLGLIDEVAGSQIISLGLQRAAALGDLPKEPVEKLKTFSAKSETEFFNSLWWNETHQAILAPRRK